MSERNFHRASLTVRWKDVIDSNNNKIFDEFSQKSFSELDFGIFFVKIDQLMERLRHESQLDRHLKTNLYQKIHDETRSVLLNELNASIECLGLKSSRISDELLVEKQIQCNKVARLSNANEIEIRKAQVADICKSFISNTKLLISAVLLGQQFNKKDFILNSIFTYCDFLKNILDLSFFHLYKLYKLVEMKQILNQLLKLTNSFCRIVNLSYLNILNRPVSLDLIVNESNSLTHEIGWIIQLFKVLF
jgi:hypothetical protein